MKFVWIIMIATAMALALDYTFGGDPRKRTSGERTNWDT